jgi:hypothetical protein
MPPDFGTSDASLTGDGSTTEGESSSEDDSSTGCEHPGCPADCDGVIDGDATLDACDVCDDNPTNDCVPSFTAEGSWDCDAGESCQDVYQVALFEGSDATITISLANPTPTLRLAVFAPGIPLDDTNLLTGFAYDWACGHTVAFTATETGVYRIAVGANLDEGDSAWYSMEVATVPGLVLGGLSIDDSAPPGPGGSCADP